MQRTLGTCGHARSCCAFGLCGPVSQCIVLNAKQTPPLLVNGISRNSLSSQPRVSMPASLGTPACVCPPSPVPGTSHCSSAPPCIWSIAPACAQIPHTTDIDTPSWLSHGAHEEAAHLLRAHWGGGTGRHRPSVASLTEACTSQGSAPHQPPLSPTRPAVGHEPPYCTDGPRGALEQAIVARCPACLWH